MLQVVDLAFDYHDCALLNGVNLLIPAGSLLHIRGGNGSGKTTLLKVLAGLYQPHQGIIQFQGQNIYLDLQDYQQQICYVGHKSGLNPYLTVQENCVYDTHFDPINSNWDDLVSIFPLKNQMHKLSGLLSAGQKRQASLLRLWMTKAPLWILDEPLVALDEQAMATLMQRIQEHRQLGGAVVLSSHQALPLSAASYVEYCL